MAFDLSHRTGRRGQSDLVLLSVLFALALPATTRTQEAGEADAAAQDAGSGERAGTAPDRADLRRAEALEEERERQGEASAAESVRRPETAAETDAGTPAVESPELRDAYELLAQAEVRGDPDGLGPVKEVFEREIEAGRNLARAHNGLGRYYLQQHEHAITILESIQKLFNWDHVTRARKHFRVATEADPDYVEAWYNWAIAGRKAKDRDALREAVAALRKVVQLDPTYRDAYRLLAVTLRDLGDFRASQRVIAEWRASPALEPALADLEEAYLEMGVEKRPGAGARLYWRGLAAATTPEEVDAYFEDVRFITGETEREAYGKLDVEGRKAWIRQFWQRSADEALVTADERVAEHYRRLAHVERAYALAIPQRRHYSAISAYRPREQSGFDDRGIIYLRHGEPDDVARFTGPNVQRNESWLYRRGGGDLVFHFVSDEDTEDFKLVTSLTDALVRGSATLGQRLNSGENAGELFESRAAFDPIYNRLAFQFDPMLLREEEENVARDVKVGTSSASYVPPSPDSLPFFTVPAAFRGADGLPAVDVYLGVPTADLEMPGGSQGTRVAFSAQLLLEDESRDSVAARAVDSLAVQLPQAPPRDEGVLIPDVLRGQAPEGKYRYRVRVTDLLSGRTGTLDGELEVPDLSGFSASSVVLASRIEPADGAGKFVHGDLKVVPLPSLRFKTGQPLFVYYEIYGLEPGEDGRLRYRTTYTIRARERKRNIAVKLLSSVGSLLGSGEKRGKEVGLEFQADAEPAEVVREHIALDLDRSEPGPYEIRVLVEDLAGGGKVERSAAFALTR